MNYPGLVTAQWLHKNMQTGSLRVLDASLPKPGTSADCKANFLSAHIPGAMFFDIKDFSDQNTDLPNMLPSAEEFANGVGKLGISNSHHVVIYDQHGIFSAPRVWWMFRVFGHDQVSVLNGGLPSWQSLGLKMESGPQKLYPAEKFIPQFRPQLVRDFDAVKSNCTLGTEQIVDFRSASRFQGQADEPIPGLRSGHIPRSHNLPYTDLLNGLDYKPNKDLEISFKQIGIDLEKPIVSSCGSGISACIGALALHELGIPDVAVYDGSWAEWARREKI